MRREIPLIIAFLTGFIMVSNFFSPLESIDSAAKVLPNWNAIIGAFAVFLALASILSVHGNRISRKEEGWIYSLVLLITLFLTLGVGFYYGPEEYYLRQLVFQDAARVEGLVKTAKEIADLPVGPDRVRALQDAMTSAGPLLGSARTETLDRNLKTIADKGIGKTLEGPDAGKYVLKVEYFNPFHWIYQYVYNPLQATMFSILAFFVASAAYRAFRARTLEGTLLLIAAFLVMLGRTSIGYWLNTQVDWLYLPWIQEWIMDTPNNAGQRAILIGAALGVISTSLRMLLGYEQTYLGNE